MDYIIIIIIIIITIKNLKIIWEVRAVPRLYELYLGIHLKTEDKARKNLS
jgi:hypothetical protein